MSIIAYIAFFSKNRTAKVKKIPAKEQRGVIFSDGSVAAPFKNIFACSGAAT
jgi:hypothetical protein